MIGNIGQRVKTIHGFSSRNGMSCSKFCAVSTEI